MVRSWMGDHSPLKHMFLLVRADWGFESLCNSFVSHQLLCSPENMMECASDADSKAKNPTYTTTANQTVKTSSNMNAEGPSKSDQDSNCLHRGESDSECSWQRSDEDNSCLDKETDSSSDERPGRSGRVKGAYHPCTFSGCKRVFHRPGRLKDHMHVHIGQRPFQCSVEGCSRSYSTSSHLKRHLKVFHKDGPKHRTMEFLCSRCWVLDNLKRGRTSEPKVRSKYVREYCSPSLGAHTCVRCGEAFRKVFREPKPAGPLILCHVCGHSFESARDFRRHERGHITYECPYMGCKNREFSFSEMRKHTASQHTHTGYTCNECMKKFLSKGMLRDHVASHLNIRQVFFCPFKDAGCERKYLHKRNLTQHIETSHNKKRFTCELCSIDLSTKQKLKCHMTSMHSQDSESTTKPKRQPKKKLKVRKGPKLVKPNMVHIMLGVRVIDEEGKKKKKKAGT